MTLLAARLTPRERNCLELAGLGLNAREISLRLGSLSPNSVNAYLHRACEKLGAGSRQEAFALLKRADRQPAPCFAVSPVPSVLKPTPDATGSTLQARILEALVARGEGGLTSLADLTDIASKEAIENGLRRLEVSGKVIKVERGFYSLPLPASYDARRLRLDDLMRQLGERRSDLLAPDGPASAYALGLLARAPIKPVYLTTKTERQFDVGKLRVTLVEADAWWFEGGYGPAGSVVRALGWAGSGRAPEAWTSLRDTLSLETRRTLEDCAARLPLWLARTVTADRT